MPRIIKAHLAGIGDEAANDNKSLKELAERFMKLFGKKDGNGNPRHANDNTKPWWKR